MVVLSTWGHPNSSSDCRGTFGRMNPSSVLFLPQAPPPAPVVRCEEVEQVRVTKVSPPLSVAPVERGAPVATVISRRDRKERFWKISDM